MSMNPNIAINSPYKGSGSLTREQFLFYEMRTTAKLLVAGNSESETIDQIVRDNLFQYPTEKSVRKMAGACVDRLNALNSEDLIRSVAEADSITAKQICLYAMMKEYRIVWDFMISVIGNKYKQQDFTFSRRDINVFFLQQQEQDDCVASWAESTVKKIGSVLARILIENEYIDNGKATVLNPVVITSTLENAIRENGDLIALPAFNCLL